MARAEALDRTQPSLPMKPGRGQAMTHDYKRHGTIDVFAAMNVVTGEVLTGLQARHAAGEVLRFFKHIDAAVPADLDVHVILDNLSTHSAPGITRWLGHPRPGSLAPALHPTSSSWLKPGRALVQGAHRQGAPPWPVRRPSQPWQRATNENGVVVGHLPHSALNTMLVHLPRGGQDDLGADHVTVSGPGRMSTDGQLPMLLGGQIASSNPGEVHDSTWTVRAGDRQAVLDTRYLAHPGATATHPP